MGRVKQIKKTGVHQGDLVELLDKVSGKLWLPMSAFDDIGAATLVAVGSSKVVAMSFDTSADEHVSTNLKVPADMDITKASTFTVYWSSVGTDDTKTFLAGIEYIARAVGEDMGVAGAIILAAADTDNGTADVLATTPVITLPANAFASVDEILAMSFFRDVSGDDIAGDVDVYGLEWNYTTLPSISS